jgi:hypothetical protein
MIVIIIIVIFFPNFIVFCSVKFDFFLKVIRNPALKSLRSIEISLYVTTETTDLRVPKIWKFYFQSDLSLMFFSSLDSLWITACFSSKSFDLILFFRYKESNGTKMKPTSIISYIISLVFKTGMSKWGQRTKCWTFILSLFLIRAFSYNNISNRNISEDSMERPHTTCT